MQTPSTDPPSLTALLKTSDSPTELVHELVLFSLRERASDIHIHPEHTESVVRIRVDGTLRTIAHLSHKEHLSLITRLKVCAHLRTDTRREPLDGRFSVAHNGTQYDIRISLLPTYYGESAVLRLLVQLTNNHSLQALGFSTEQTLIVSQTLTRQSGMILTTGPTGSGKTTTLYTLLSLFPIESLSIVTLEDPIEYALSGIKQVPIQHGSFTFATGLRTILRQDPNVIMVGEIRDTETAELSINAALTGHLLLSTLHTTDAPGAITRLLQMHIEPYLLSATLSLIIGQRLVRTLCNTCKMSHTITEAERSYYGIYAPIPSGSYATAVGCAHCNGSGFYGRTIIAEILVPDELLRESIAQGISRLDIRTYIARSGMIRLWEQGVILASRGETSLAEVFRVMNE